MAQLAMYEPYSFRALTKVVEEHAAVKPSLDVRMIVPKKSSHDLH